jgi:DNA-binding NtrC family response regulator
MISVLVVDDDRTARETLAAFLATLGYSARTAASPDEGRQAVADDAPDLVLIDVRLPDSGGLTLLGVLVAEDPGLGAIMLAGRADVPAAMQAMQRGALDVLQKPIDLDALSVSLTRAVELVRLRREVSRVRAHQFEGPLTPPSVDRLIDLAAQNDDVSVLIVGEPGTGKCRVARQIHARSSRAAQPFVEVDGASASLESELFGHERGTLAGATAPKRGLLEAASTGTLFVQMVDAVAAGVQSKLLDVLENRTFHRRGGTVELRCDARVLAATSRTLEILVAEGSFRADLCHRLQVLTLALPPLRERAEELPLLALACLPTGARLSANASRALKRYQWPGNVRELENTLWRAALIAGDTPIEARHLGLPHAASTTPASAVTLEDAERRAIRDALELTGGNKVHAARVLGIARSTLLEKLKKLDGG